MNMFEHKLLINLPSASQILYFSQYCKAAMEHFDSNEWYIAVHMLTPTLSASDVCSKQIPYYVITDNDTPWTIGSEHAMY